MKKIVKRCLIVGGVSLFVLCSFCISYIGVKYIKYSKIPLQTEAITSPSLSVEIYAKDNTKLEDENQFNGDYCKLEDLSDNTKNAFISIEDKSFYKHNGINKKRILKAFLNNLKSGKMKEGASTITQQLIKNTHLSSEKTIDRKLKEIALAKKLEKKFSKEKILESYLNIIFFGNNCYGIESAAKYYFGKSAKDLSLEEGCTLAGMIKSPTRYSPITHYDNCIARRNLVISEMEKDGHITEEEKLLAQNKPIVLQITKKESNKLNTYSQSALDEACKLLNLPAKQIALGGYKIHTYFDKEKQSCLAQSLANHKLANLDDCAVVIDNSSLGIFAYQANSNYKLFDLKRPPASCLKPILVYAPALNENVISPATQILDEEIQIGSYKPENVNKKFAGYMSITDAVKNSVNIPAIKTLSYIGIDTGKQYAEKAGITFDEKDTSYVLALGGMTYGTTLTQLTNAYTSLANGGEFDKATFIQYITDKNNKIVYLHRPQKKMVFREDSAALMTKILQETAKSGTARKLSSITHTEIASKTGTAGKKNGNTDAYNISYTPQETIGVWFGSLDNTPSNIAGGNQPTAVVADYVSSQHYDKTKFDMPTSVTMLKIDSLEKDTQHRIVLANPNTPERYTETALFSRFNFPTEISSNFSQKPEISAKCEAKNGQIVLTINPQKHIEYQIYKDDLPYQIIKDKNSSLSIKMPFSKNDAKIVVLAKYSNVENENLTNKTEFILSQQQANWQKVTKKWYI